MKLPKQMNDPFLGQQRSKRITRTKQQGGKTTENKNKQKLVAGRGGGVMIAEPLKLFICCLLQKFSSRSNFCKSDLQKYKELSLLKFVLLVR